MKRCSSIVWRFFERIQNEDNRCFAVLCKLCDTQYKFFGNTTNLRTHLINKHPLQWELTQSSSFDESTFRADDDESTNQSTTVTPKPKRRKYSMGYKDKNVDVLENSEVENEINENEENEATYNLVRQLHDSRGSDEEWLEDDNYTAHVETYDTKRRVPYKKIKREIQTPPRRMSTYTPKKRYEKPAPAPIIIDQSNFKDEYSTFGEYVANKLRKFKAPRTRGNLQQLITTILWQAEYGMYDNAEAVKRVLMFTVQESEQAHNIARESEHSTEIIIEQRDEEPNQSVESEVN